VNIDPSSGEVIKSCCLDSVNGQIAPMDNMDDSHNNFLNDSEMDGLITERDLTLKEIEDWNI
jgi:hypothetical protein